MNNGGNTKKADPNDISGQLGTIEVSKKYFSNMQKRMNQLLPKLHLKNVSVLREFLNIYDWLDAEKIEKESAKYIIDEDESSTHQL